MPGQTLVLYIYVYLDQLGPHFGLHLDPHGPHLSPILAQGNLFKAFLKTCPKPKCGQHGAYLKQWRCHSKGG